MSTLGNLGYLTQLLAAMRQDQTASTTPPTNGDIEAANLQPYDADLSAIASLTGTSGLLRKSGLNTWVLDNSNYLTTITSSDVTTALGYTPVTNARTLTINGVTYDLTANRSWTIAGGVTSFNTRTGAITLLSTDITSTLGYTPYNAANPAGYISSYTETDPTVGSHIKAITTTNISNWNTAYGWGNHASAGYLTGITSGQVTTALGYTPENAANKGVANGYASLDGSGLIPSTQLPSYVDDVLEYTNLASFPATGTTGKIYIDLATNKVYRWSGTVYIEVSPTVGTIWGGITGTLANQTDLQTALDAKVPTSRTLTINGTAFDLSANRSWTINSMVYPAAGIAVSTGTAWGTSITDNSTNWNTAYTNRITSLTVTGSSGSATLVSNVLNIPTYTLAGLGGQASSTNLTSLSGLSYVSASFVKMTAVGTFTLDTNTYYLSSNPSNYIALTALSSTATGLTYTNTTGVFSLTSGYSIPTTASQTNWDSAFTERRQWDGGSTNLVAATGRTSLGATTVGANLFTLVNPTAITFIRINADNTVSILDAATFRTAIGAGTSSTTGTVTSVSGTGTVSGLSLSGTVTTTGNITLGGTLAVTASNFSSQTANTFLAAPNGAAGVPTFRTIVAADIPTLNQNTSGSAGSVANSLILKADTGTTEGTDLYTYNGSAAKTLNIVAGSNITITKVAGQWTIAAAAGATGTVSSVSGTGTVSGLTLTGTVTTTGSLTLGGTLAVTASNFASQTANTFLAAPNGTAGTPTFRAIVAADVPTLNQNTTGTAATITGVYGGTITSSQITTGLGFTPYNSTNPSGYITSSGSISGSAGSAPALTASGGLTTQYGSGIVGYSYALTNPQTGLFTAVDNSNSILTVNRHPGDYYSQLGFSSNGNLYYRSFSATAINTSAAWRTIWDSGTLTNLNQLTNGPGYLTGITSGQVTTALGYTPYNSTNPNGYITSSADISGYSARLISSDVRTISPSSHSTYRATFGFTSWANNNTSPYADYFHLRSYSDSSGGSDNLIMFRKDALGIRIWQQTYGSATAYATYKDVAWTDGTNASGTWGISISGNAATSTTATTATTATNWGSYGAVPNAGTSFGNANTIGRSDGNGYTFFNYINSNTANSENPAVSQVIVTSGVDNYYRKSSISSFTGYVQSNASGTWGISISGNAATASSATTATTANTASNLSNFTNQSGARYTTDFNSILTTGFFNAEATPTNSPGGSYGQLIVAKGIDTGFQIYGGYVNDALYFRGWHSSGTFTSWRTVLHNGNYTSYSPSLTGSGASGTWGINVTGTAGSETLATVTSRGATTNSDITVAGYLTVNGAGTSSSIYMKDSDEGNREIHCNSNRIGFLTQAGAWGAYCDDSGNWAAANFSGSSSGTNTGDQTNISGNAATASSVAWSGITSKPTTLGGYGITDAISTSSGTISGTLVVQGGGANGVTVGLYARDVTAARTTNTGVIYFGSDGNHYVYFDGTNYAMPSGNLYVNAGLVLTTGNYTSYAPSTTGSGASGTWGINVTGTAGSAPNGSNANGAYNVSPGEGNGVYFWSDSTNYTIKMGYTAGTYQYGPVTDYSMRFTMGAGTGRGFTWGYAGAAPTMGLNANSGNLQIAGTFTEASSIRYKEDIQDLTYSVEDVLKLRGVTYKKKGTSHTEIGVIAEEVNDIIPEVVAKNSDGSVESVSYGRLTAVLIEAIKEQQKQIDELKNLLHK